MPPIDPTQHKTWDQTVEAFSGHTVFHSAGWARVLCESYSYKPCYFTLGHRHEISAALPMMEIRSPLTGKRGVSLPFTDDCPVLARNAADAESLFQEARQYGRKAGWKYIELRSGSEFFSGFKPFCTYLTHTLDLSVGEKKLFKRLRSSTRRNIQKAQKLGVKTAISNSSDALKEFCRLNAITRKKHGIPPQPDKFFRKIREHLLLRNCGFTALAFYKEKAVAGAVYLHFGKSALFKYGASHPGYLSLRPNNLVMWTAIRQLAEQGFSTMSFGRTDPENDGLLQFKRGWNPVETRLEYIRYNLQSRTSETSKKSPKHTYKLFQKMPIPLLNLLGRLLYRHVG